MTSDQQRVKQRPFHQRIRWVTVVDEHKIARNPCTGQVTTKRESKDYKIVFDKHIFREKYNTFPDINFQTIKDIVTGKGSECVTVVDEHKIARNPCTGHVITKRESKDYKIVFDKPIIGDKYNTYPYGY
ncbi:hypothetical protein MAR_001466 [Mya arenaria]|uniref:Uncharacterized protein n=1 Tax=Mya arenaria TaxID=6604 RepID=A0ABY7FFY5_MYAAR|nr:hypothetical protein MAR_001466 [Mya arenaria]